jgi:N-acetylneuraminic acid mutarotase
MPALHPLAPFPRFAHACRVHIVAAAIAVSAVAACGETAPLPSLPETRVGGATAQLGDTVYYFGGASLAGGRFRGNVPSVLALDLRRGEWSVVAPCPARSGFAAAAVGGAIFLSGGSDDAGRVADDSLYGFDPDTRRLRVVSHMPAPRYQHGMASLGPVLYIVGGGPREHALLEPARETWAYDTKVDRWTRKADMPLPMRNLCLVAHEGRLYAIGGHRVGPDNPGNIVQEFDPVTNVWRRMADMPTARTDCAAVAMRGRIYVLGGHPGLAVVESFDPRANAWRPEAALPKGRFAPAAFPAEDAIVVLAGAPNETLRYPLARP